MKEITLLQPQKIVFGTGCIERFKEDYLSMGYKRLFIVTLPFMLPSIKDTTDSLAASGVDIEFYTEISAEPSITDFKTVLAKAQAFKADSFLGICIAI